MPLLNKSTPIDAYRGINAANYKLVWNTATDGGEDVARIQCLKPDCNGPSVTEKLKAAYVQLALNYLDQGKSLTLLPDFCNCEDLKCLCAEDLEVPFA